ncbi:MAG: hypothetical protein M3R55_02695 [Acidobacteriota bacterium]|nr:hypothetical protein [Acidobacteriota bacterium]
MTLARPGSRLFPWYDSWWLAAYARATEIIAQACPARLPGFVDAMRVFEAPQGFNTPVLDHVFDASTFAEIRETISALRPEDLELHEARAFGRFVVHNHPYFSELHRRTVGLVSEAAGEPVEPTYNFLSLYGGPGVCPLHLDSPQAKWTLDLCVNQSGPWPIYFSEALPWPAPDAAMTAGAGWQDAVKRELAFAPVTLEPGQAVCFSGSSQWHYRDALPRSEGRQFCELLFFHFVPAGTRQLSRPDQWAGIFGVPELEGLGGGEVVFI